jgi:hypothetical protein
MGEAETETEMERRALIHGLTDFALCFFQGAMAMEHLVTTTQKNAAFSLVSISLCAGYADLQCQRTHLLLDPLRPDSS